MHFDLKIVHGAEGKSQWGNRKRLTAVDGERLTVVWWRDEASLTEWRNQMRHREAQNTGRQKWYQYYDVDVATIVRSRSFVRK